MQRISFRLIRLGVGISVIFSCVMVGCGTLKREIAHLMLEDVHRHHQFEMDHSIENHASHLADALAKAQTGQSAALRHSPEAVSQVQWLDQPPVLENTDHQAVQQRDDQSFQPPVQVEAKPASDEQVAEVISARADQSPDVGSRADWAPLDQETLLSQLVSTIRSSDDPPVNKAISVAALSLIHPGRTLNDVDLQPLTLDQRERVEQYHKVMTSLARDLPRDKDTLESASFGERVRHILDQGPIQIRDLQICRRVRGYGVYEPFETEIFLAGREQPIIIYVELDYFRSVESSDGRHRVRLAQDVVLYNEADGLAVWKQPKVDIVDESRNRRRDFFVVQMIKLPARLSVGKYFLKVRISDLNGGSLDEATIPIQFVADESLVLNQAKK